MTDLAEQIAEAIIQHQYGDTDRTHEDYVAVIRGVLDSHEVVYAEDIMMSTCKKMAGDFASQQAEIERKRAAVQHLTWIEGWQQMLHAEGCADPDGGELCQCDGPAMIEDVEKALEDGDD